MPNIQEALEAMYIIKDYCSNHQCYIEGADQRCPLLIKEDQCFFEDRFLAGTPAKWPINIINRPIFELELKER